MSDRCPDSYRIRVDPVFELNLLGTGIRFFRLRIHHLLHSMFKLESIHLAATLLHPRYRLLKKYSLDEVRECYAYIRQRVAQIKSMKTCKSTFDISEKHSSMANNVTLNEPVKKKLKRFGEYFEIGNLSDEFDIECDDELNKYLEQLIDTKHYHFGMNIDLPILFCLS